MGKQARKEQIHLAGVLRAAGRTWPEIATELRRRWPTLTPLAAMRLAHGWTQTKAADAWNTLWPTSDTPKTYKDISDQERRRASFKTLDKLAQLYQCAVTDLLADEPDYRHLDAANTPIIQVNPYEEDKDDEVRRREFLTGTAAIAVTGFVSSGSQPRVGTADVEALRAELQRLYGLDDHSGGGAVYRLALDHMSTVRGVLANASYSEITGRRLYSLAGQAAEHAGWSAYDAGSPQEAQSLYSEALYMADLAEDPRLRTLVFTSMSLNAETYGSPREALDLSHMAQRTARPFATPRLGSLLASREALAYSRLGDRARCHSALVVAEQVLDDHHDEDDEEWMSFYCSAQLMGTAAQAHLYLGADGDAEAAVRTALDVAPSGYRRNDGLYLTRLAETLVPQRKFDEAASIATTVIDRMSDVSSQRMHNSLGVVKQALAPHDDVPEVRELLAR